MATRGTGGAQGCCELARGPAWLEILGEDLI